MPQDKQSKTSTNPITTKPITPALSSRFRTAKTPVAPRLAATSSPVASTTNARKDLREQVLSPPSGQNKTSSLGQNITPRSGTRTARISTESPTSPSTRRLSSGSSIQGTLHTARPTPAVTSPTYVPSYRLATKASSPTLSSTRRSSGSSDISKRDDGTAKFVRANDARSPHNFQSPRSTLTPRPLSTTFIKTASPRTTNSAPPSAINGGGTDRKDGKFVRANDAQAHATRPPVVVRKQSTASLASMNNSKSRGSPQLLRTQTYPLPPKATTTKASPSKIIPLTSFKPVSPAQTPLQISPTVTSHPDPSSHRRSFGSSGVISTPTRPVLHKKSASVSCFHQANNGFLSALAAHETRHIDPNWTPPTVMVPVQPNNRAISTPETISPRSTSLASSKTMGTSVTSDTDASEISKTGLSYTTSAPSDSFPSIAQTQALQSTPLAQAQMNAAHARRERKVLDLEISNSSLLAINKTLEKELRKQSAELRRFRRLSRSGRLSLAPSNRSVSIQSALSLDTLQEQSEDEEDYSEEDDHEDESDEQEDDMDEDLDNPLSQNTPRARRRARDERRLMLDLSKHQQLLIDSQKLTQSIKKCLSVSEELIKEGNQALKYKVGIGDVKLGGRVLSVDDLEETNEHNEESDVSRQGLLSPSIARMALQEVDLWLRDAQLNDNAMGYATPDSQKPD